MKIRSITELTSVLSLKTGDACCAEIHSVKNNITRFNIGYLKYSGFFKDLKAARYAVDYVLGYDIHIDVWNTTDDCVWFVQCSPEVLQEYYDNQWENEVSYQTARNMGDTIDNDAYLYKRERERIRKEFASRRIVVENMIRRRENVQAIADKW